MPDLPDFLNPETWQDFCEYRVTESKGKKFGPIAQKRMLKYLERLHNEGFDVEQCLDECMSNGAGWQKPYGREEFKRKAGPRRETTVTKLELVETSDKQTAAAALAEMKQRV
jgi:hypothetical protein